MSEKKLKFEFEKQNKNSVRYKEGERVFTISGICTKGLRNKKRA
jgi:hypothetical protein